MANIAGRRALKSALQQEARITPEQIKHLELIQAVIARLAGNSFLAKGWAVTVAGAIYGFAAAHLNAMVAAIGILPVAAFWWLDAYFLRLERQYRCLYNDVRVADSRIEPFSMDVRSYLGQKSTSWRSVMLSLTLKVFYGMLLGVGIVLVVAGIVHSANDSQASRTVFATSSFISSV